MERDHGGTSSPSLDEARRCNCKIGGAMDRYSIPDLNEVLVDRWQGNGVERASLRTLAEDVNRRLTAEALMAANERPLDGEVENIHRLLTDDEVSEGTRTKTRKRLERQGLDVERLQKDFVSHQTVYRHLTDCLGVERPTESDEDNLEKGKNTILSLQSRTAIVTTETLERLDGSDRITLTDFDVLVDVQVICNECGTSYPVSELLDSGGCH